MGRLYRDGVGKSGVLGTKAAIALKCVNIEEKLLWKAYRKSQTLFRTVPSRPLRPPLPHDWGFATPPKTSIAVISGTAKATNFKFCTHIQRIDRNKSPLKFSGKVTVGILRDCGEIFRTPIYRAYRAVIFAVAQLSSISLC